MKTMLLSVVGLLLVATLLGWWLANRSDPPTSDAAMGGHDAGYTELDGTVYWTCPMHPQVHRGAPGNCPICGMKLVQRRMSTGAGSDTPAIVEIDPHMAQNLGMRTALVEIGATPRRIRAVGSVQLNERGVVAVEARASGWLERLNVRAIGDSVTRGQVLAEINAPELRAAQEELALAERVGEAALVDAARRRLMLLGASERASDDAKGRTRIVAPQSGIVTELSVREGAQLSPGVSLMKIADLESVWIIAEIPEAVAAAIAVGAEADVRVKGASGKAFRGVVDYVYPLLDSQTRTVRARLVVENPGRELKPGMFAEVTLTAAPIDTAIFVPSEAVIRTGTRNLVLVAEGEGRYRPVEVEIGDERGDRIVVLTGVAPGQRVVVSGQFLIDSEASLVGLYRRTADESPAARMRLMGEEPGPTVYGGEREDGSP